MRIARGMASEWNRWKPIVPGGGTLAPARHGYGEATATVERHFGLASDRPLDAFRRCDRPPTHMTDISLRIE